MHRRSAALVVLLSVAIHCHGAEPERYTIKTLPAQMRYDVTELMIKPGAEVKILFENPDAMPHNIVFFQPGTDVVAICNKQMEKPEEALKRNWLPEDPRIWLHSKTLNPNEKEELGFKAPEKPGIYPFVCSMPGHAQIMQGRLNIFAPAPQLTDLKFQFYLGDWKKLPDFGGLQVHREGDLPDHLIQIKLDDYKNQFGVVYTGKFKAVKAGEYVFAVASDDGARLLVDGKKVIENDGIHPSSTIKEGKVKLEEGDHQLRVEYFQGTGEAEIFAAWRGPGFGMTPLSKWVPAGWKEGAAAAKKNDGTGMPLVVQQEPVIYRNFISGAGNRAIGVGYPGGINIAWSVENMNLALVWRGAFIDAARHWTDRGAGAQPPLGYDVFRPTESSIPFAVLASADAEWPQASKGERPENFQWKGYELDAKRFPTFFYRWGDVTIREKFETAGDAAVGSGRLIRTLELSGNIPPGAMFRVASGNAVQARDGDFMVDSSSKFVVSAPGAKIVGKNILLPAQQTLRAVYTWPGTPGPLGAAR